MHSGCNGQPIWYGGIVITGFLFNIVINYTQNTSGVCQTDLIEPSQKACNCTDLYNPIVQRFSGSLR